VLPLGSTTSRKLGTGSWRIGVAAIADGVWLSVVAASEGPVPSVEGVAGCVDAGAAPEGAEPIWISLSASAPAPARISLRVDAGRFSLPSDEVFAGGVTTTAPPPVGRSSTYWATAEMESGGGSPVSATAGPASVTRANAVADETTKQNRNLGEA
jgi:hypothetical protein